MRSLFLLALLCTWLTGKAQNTPVSVVNQPTVHIAGGTTFTTSGNSTVTPAAGSTFTFTPSGSSTFPITFPTGALTVSTPTNATGAGTVSTGARSILFQTSSNFVGTINTTSYSASSNISYGAILSYTYPAISYSVTTGTLTISAIR